MQDPTAGSDSLQAPESFAFPVVDPAVADPLAQVLRRGARQMLVQAVEIEAAAWIDQRAHLLDEQGLRQVVRNGHAEARIAVQDGYRESEQFWLSMLLDLKQRGLTVDPKLATADGALGFWAACRKLWPTTREQRCWVHKTANVLDQLPKRLHDEAKDKLHQIWMAPDRAAAQQALELFGTLYAAKYPAAAERLLKDRDVLLSFYDFPAEHWIHLRTTNPIESTFATVRLRHARTKGNGSRRACLAMVFKLCESAQKRWRKLNGHELLQDVIAGVIFTDGEKQQAA